LVVRRSRRRRLNVAVAALMSAPACMGTCAIRSLVARSSRDSSRARARGFAARPHLKKRRRSVVCYC
jgi:hypothetical protein